MSLFPCSFVTLFHIGSLMNTKTTKRTKASQFVFNIKQYYKSISFATNHLAVQQASSQKLANKQSN